MSIRTAPLADAQLRELLTIDHRRLNQLFDDVLSAFREGDHADAAALWTQFETGLRNHFVFEEVRLFPQFRQEHPDAAAELAADHTRLGSMLSELSVGLDLHLTRADMVEQFIGLLRSHAAREEALLYRYAKRANKLPIHTARAARD